MSVIFYSTHCPKCGIMEKKLKQKNIEYTEVNDIEEMSKLGIQSAPCLSVDGELFEFAPGIRWINEQGVKNGIN